MAAVSTAGRPEPIYRKPNKMTQDRKEKTAEQIIDTNGLKTRDEATGSMENLKYVVDNNPNENEKSHRNRYDRLKCIFTKLLK